MATVARLFLSSSERTCCDASKLGIGLFPMRKVQWIFVLLVLVTPLVAAFAGPAEEVGSVIDRWGSTFNSNNVDALVNLYAPDAILVGTAGFTLKEGSDAIREYFARLAKSGDTVAIDNRKVIMLGDDVAYVTGFYTFSSPRNGRPEKSPAGFTMVLVKRGDAWLIVHHHSSRRSSLLGPLPLRRG
jgi:uncharacterized protein (TIGR02246 family)